MVSAGDPITLSAGFEMLAGRLAVARAFDDRIGAFIVVETMRRLSRARLKAAVFGTSTVQEEVGSRGALTSSFKIAPDIAIAIDVCAASDHPESDKKSLGDVKLGKGPVLYQGSNINPTLGELLVGTAKREKIPFQFCGPPGPRRRMHRRCRSLTAARPPR